jgi:acyl carrier protein
VGVYLHWKHKGYHFYEAPLSWDRRMGVSERETILEELSPRFNVGKIERILDKIGYYEALRITEAVASVGHDGQGNAYLAGYYVSPQPIEEARLREHLGQLLPDYMVPQYLVWLERMPLTVNGKLDRKALPDPRAQQPRAGFTSLSKTEHQLMGLWEEVLKTDKSIIDAKASFFALGGNSILASRLLTMIEKRFAISLDLKDIFENNTIEQLSKRIESRSAGETAPIPHVGDREYYQASSAQERLFYQQMLDKHNVQYNASGALEIKGSVSVEKLTRALQALVDRHESLRTSFLLAEGGVFQRIHPVVDFKLIELDDLPHRTVGQAYLDFIRPFDLTTGPLLRCGLLRTKENRSFLFMDVHHIVCDGVSFNLLMNDFVKLYHGQKPDPLEVRYVDYANWQRNDQRQNDKLKQYWLQKLEDLPELDLPIRRQRDEAAVYQSATQLLKVEGELYRQIKKLKSTASVSDFMILLSAYYILLHKVTGNDDIVIGSDVMGRTHSRVKEIVGSFINVLPLRVKIPAAASFQEFVQYVKETVLDAYSHQDYPFDQMVSELGKGDASRRNAIIRVHFAFSNQSEVAEVFKHAAFEPCLLKGPATTDYEFKIQATDTDKAYHIEFIYARELYDESLMASLTQYYSHILAAIADHAGVPIEDMQLEKVLDEVG